MDILSKILPNWETDLSLQKQYVPKLKFFEKEKGKWYLKSHDSEGKDKLVYNVATGKSAPEEIVRQLFLTELTEHYHYPKNRLKCEQNVSFGRNGRGRADIVVYQEDETTPWILVEVKAPSQKNSIQQLKSYLNNEGSPLGVGVNGNAITRLFRPYPKEFDDSLPDIPTEAEYQQVKDEEHPAASIKDIILGRKWTLSELEKINENKQFNLRKIIEVLEELVLANSGADSFTEIFKLIYAKLYDEWEAENRKDKSLLFRQYKTAEVTKREIGKLFDDAKKEWKGIFAASDSIELTPEHLNVCVGELTEVKLFFSNLRIIDEAFEYLIPDVAKSKKGQYFTPRPVIDFCVRMINPSNKEYVIDPACGSAGFLVHTMEYVWNKYKMTTEKAKVNYASKYLWGIDFDEKSAKISRAIMLIAGDGKTHIFKQNSLEHPKWTPEITVELQKEDLISDDKNKHLHFDIVMSNPPFAGDIQEKSLINLYNEILGHRYTFKIDTGKIKAMINTIAEEFEITFTDEGIESIIAKVKEINKDEEIDLESEDDQQFACQLISQVMIDAVLEGELFEPQLTPRIKEIINFKKNESKWEKVDRHILFIERVLDLLNPGGRAVIVLPQGIFNNSSEKYVRKFVTSKARILAVVGLHGNSFKPHTGTKTSLLFLKKYEEGEEIKDYPIFFATSKISFKNNSGEYIFLQDKEGNVVLDENKNPVYQTDLSMIADAYEDWGKKRAKAGDVAFDFLNN
ncbi:type I restriction enzyme M protein [Lacibacter cauensis]|uniref:Type I restriction enzyme M protein n=1 Tax=Lacibacter cauensis TaxID=510947 RepID=A0A562SIP5_9BACT|nr:N-6 DNA methylase [Lacibacter cauensis]TWI81141.1 type I restriction enzyme M protein [Lacibacter cauensis]